MADAYVLILPGVDPLTSHIQVANMPCDMGVDVGVKRTVRYMICIVGNYSCLSMITDLIFLY